MKMMMNNGGDDGGLNKVLSVGATNNHGGTNFHVPVERFTFTILEKHSPTMLKLYALPLTAHAARHHHHHNDHRCHDHHHHYHHRQPLEYDEGDGDNDGNSSGDADDANNKDNGG